MELGGEDKRTESSPWEQIVMFVFLVCKDITGREAQETPDNNVFTRSCQMDPQPPNSGLQKYEEYVCAISKLNSRNVLWLSDWFRIQKTSLGQVMYSVVRRAERYSAGTDSMSSSDLSHTQCCFHGWFYHFFKNLRFNTGLLIGSCSIHSRKELTWACDGQCASSQSQL